MVGERPHKNHADDRECPRHSGEPADGRQLQIKLMLKISGNPCDTEEQDRAEAKERPSSGK